MSLSDMISGIVFWRTQPASSLGGERAEEERRSKVSSNLEIKWQAGNNFGLRVASTVYFPKTHIHNSHVQQLYIYNFVAYYPTIVGYIVLHPM